jgi:hypothetical protein
MYRCLREEVRSGVGRAPIFLIGAGEVCDRVLTVLFLPLVSRRLSLVIFHKVAAIYK